MRRCLDWSHCNDQQASVIRELCTLRDASDRLGRAYEVHLDDISKFVLADSILSTQ
ncbi:hypothetical protein M431DRAFT_508741 [Trichoderma harzianum CBS 226.95]|uniref:Uncharacterized protein n=1 Tax=Trichoderma harzianum CBS 226.95 TaxID=983964 RepID=A0A2T4A998_TRIHA|nr:hypothetical protein M431DRAFT_508741 [Trichoderma harzianum CBS 226.95]PTB53641.1 hypothetical protein M431DRAFT_508741 [Trichoderma harzianum CBS 226.95]